MDSGQDLIINRDKERQNAKDAVNKIFSEGAKAAEHTKQYEIELAKLLLIEALKKSNDETKIPATFVKDVCKGNPLVADLKMKATIATTYTKGWFEAVNVSKLEVNIIQKDIEKEWGRKE